jgi:hypothetical protein
MAVPIAAMVVAMLAAAALATPATATAAALATATAAALATATALAAATAALATATALAAATALSPAAVLAATALSTIVMPISVLAAVMMLTVAMMVVVIIIVVVAGRRARARIAGWLGGWQCGGSKGQGTFRCNFLGALFCARLHIDLCQSTAADGRAEIGQQAVLRANIGKVFRQCGSAGAARAEPADHLLGAGQDDFAAVAQFEAAAA